MPDMATRFDLDSIAEAIASADEVGPGWHGADASTRDAYRAMASAAADTLEVDEEVNGFLHAQCWELSEVHEAENAAEQRGYTAGFGAALERVGRGITLLLESPRHKHLDKRTLEELRKRANEMRPTP
jgi:hypothetical protein